MKHLIKALLFLSIFIFSCEKEDIDTSHDSSLKNLVENTLKSAQLAPDKNNLENKKWSCVDWHLKFYNGKNKIGEWNSFNKSIKQDEKKQLYSFKNGTFTIEADPSQSTTLEGSNKENSYELKEDGLLIINDLLFIPKWDNNSLVLYYNIEKSASIGKLFNITIDNTYGKNLQKEGGIVGLGTIKFIINKNEDIDQNIEISSLKLINSFISREKISTHIFNKIETTTGLYQFELSGVPGSNDVSKTKVSIENQLVVLDNITPNRAKLLFTAFLKKQAFVFKGVDIMINKICHEDGSGNSFLVYGITGSNKENVAFYYNVQTGKEHWNKPPVNTNTNELASYDLIEKFIKRQQILNHVYNSLGTTNDDFTFLLGEGSDQIVLEDQQVDLNNLTQERAKLLFTSFLMKQTFTFKGVDVMINKICHEDGSGNSFLVYGTSGSNNENVAFYYNIQTGKEHWN